MPKQITPLPPSNPQFLQQLESRLNENRRLISASPLPSFLHGFAGYLGFHPFRTLFILSFSITLFSFIFLYQPLIILSRHLFLYP